MLALLVALPAPAWADFEQDKRRCVSDPNPDIKIGGCTRLIQSGRLDNNNLAFTFNTRGIAYQNKGQYDRAIRDYNEAIRFKPDFAIAFYNRGDAYKNKGQYDRAIRDYSKAIRLKPNVANFYGNRGNTYGLLGQRAKAIADYRKAIELRPGDRVGTAGLKHFGVTP